MYLGVQAKVLNGGGPVFPFHRFAYFNIFGIILGQLYPLSWWLVTCARNEGWCLSSKVCRGKILDGSSCTGRFMLWIYHLWPIGVVGYRLIGSSGSHFFFSFCAKYNI